MLNHVSVVLLIFVGIVSWWDTRPEETTTLEDMSVYEVAQLLGDTPANHELKSGIPGVSAENGKELFHTGYITKPNGQRAKKQSKHFVCTSCHLFQVEDTDLGSTSPEDRLSYAVDNGLPFLQGTTLYGAVNRRTFYNGDYKKKYGPETVNKVKEDLRESIQLCAVGCAQGRALDTWEIESVLAYFWTLELQMSDLTLTSSEMDVIQQAVDKGQPNSEALKLLKGQYSQAAPATFTELPDDFDQGYSEEGDAENGELIYKLSCLHCHENGRYSYYSLDTHKLSLKHLARHFSKPHSPYNTYKLISEGTLPVYGDKEYMPQYPIERLSKQQIEDLRAYVSRK